MQLTGLTRTGVLHKAGVGCAGLVR
jgi:hypothetical protein